MKRAQIQIHEEQAAYGLASFVPPSLEGAGLEQSDIPFLAHDPEAMAAIAEAVQRVPTRHDLYLGDARDLDAIADESVHLVVTSPPYWTLKDYNPGEGQLGYVEDY